MENSKIGWTDHTFSAWWGCTKVHAGCANCYAEAWDHRWGGGHWGANAPRRMIKGEWSKPDRWNREARAAGVPARVFIASMSDLFEKYDGPVVDNVGAVQAGVSIASLRARLWPIMERTTWLRYLLLTKRPENVMGMVPEAWTRPGAWPAHVWVGTSPCDQVTAEKCVPALLRLPGRKFLSCEPLLANVDLVGYGLTQAPWQFAASGLAWSESNVRYERVAKPGIDWVIVGGESEQRGNCRRFPVGVAEQIVEQCGLAGIPVFVKQFGSMPQVETAGAWAVFSVNGRPLAAHKGDVRAEWPEWAVQEVPPALKFAPSGVEI